MQDRLSPRKRPLRRTVRRYSFFSPLTWPSTVLLVFRGVRRSANILFFWPRPFTRSAHGANGRLLISALLPQAKPSDKSIGVVSRSAIWRQFFQFLNIAASQNDIIGF